MISLIQDKESFIAFRPQWEMLYAIDEQATPFQKFDYIACSIDFFLRDANNLYIVAVKDDPTNKWIAVFPFILDKKGNLLFVNAEHSDFCMPLVHPEYKHYNLYKEFSEFIKKDDNVKGFDLDNIMADNPLLSVLKPYFPYMITHDINFYSSIPIYHAPSDVDVIDAFRYVRSNAKRHLRKLRDKAKQDLHFEIFRKNDNKNYPQECVDNLVQSMLSNGIRDQKYFSSAMLSFLKELYEKNILFLALLYKGEETLSCNFIYYDEKNNEYIKWLMLYKESSWNMIINIMFAEYLYKNEFGTDINFARGIYDYKLNNFHPDIKPLFRVKIAKTPWGHIKNVSSVVIHYCKPFIKSFLRR